MTENEGCKICDRKLKFQEKRKKTVVTKDDFVRVTMYCVYCSVEQHFQFPVKDEEYWTRRLSL